MFGRGNSRIEDLTNMYVELNGLNRILNELESTRKINQQVACELRASGATKSQLEPYIQTDKRMDSYIASTLSAKGKIVGKFAMKAILDATYKTNKILHSTNKKLDKNKYIRMQDKVLKSDAEIESLLKAIENVSGQVEIDDEYRNNFVRKLDERLADREIAKYGLEQSEVSEKL